MSKLEEAIKKFNIEKFNEALAKEALEERLFRENDSLENMYKGVQAAALINMAESFEAKMVAADVCNLWSRPKDIYMIRLYFASMKMGERADFKEVCDLACSETSAVDIHLMAAAARIARADKIKYKGEGLFADMPTEKEILERRSKSDRIL